MEIPSLETIIAYTTLCFAVVGVLLVALWLSLIVWAFRDMRLRSRDPFAQLLAALVVAALPGAGILIYWILRPPETLAESYERALEEEALLQEIEQRPACPGCSRTVDKAWMVCPHCHTRLRKKCPDCGEAMDLHWNLCAHCGNHMVDPYHVDTPAPARVAESTAGPATAALDQPAYSDDDLFPDDPLADVGEAPSYYEEPPRHVPGDRTMISDPAEDAAVVFEDDLSAADEDDADRDAYA